MKQQETSQIPALDACCMQCPLTASQGLSPVLEAIFPGRAVWNILEYFTMIDPL